MLAILYFGIKVVKYDVGSESDCGYPEAGEHAGEHGAVGEHGVFTPGFSLGPWITEKWQVCHAVCGPVGGWNEHNEARDRKSVV